MRGRAMILERYIGEADDGRVLRDYIKREFDISARLLRRIKTRYSITINGAVAFTNVIVKGGDRLQIDLGAVTRALESVIPEDVPIDVIYEDEYIIAINKQAGRIVHPSAYDGGGTIANGLARYYERTGRASGIHPISRLDRDTTGVILFAKNAYTANAFNEQLRGGGFCKEYLGVSQKAPEPEAGVIDIPLGRVDGYIMLRAARCDGKPAKTYYETLLNARGMCLILMRPVTGRTHQLRAHMSSIGCALVSDGLYGPEVPNAVSSSKPHAVSSHKPRAVSSPKPRAVSTGNPRPDDAGDITMAAAPLNAASVCGRQALHSWRLTFHHPYANRYMTLTAPLPDDFRSLIDLMLRYKVLGAGRT